MATSFGTLYEAIRVATGNDDPVLGAEVMPDSRCEVLVRTAASTLRAYSQSFEPVGYQQDGTTWEWQLFPTLDPTGTPAAVTLTAIAHVAAHRYFVGLGNEKAAKDVYATISDLAILAGGEPVIGYKALGDTQERFQEI